MLSTIVTVPIQAKDKGATLDPGDILEGASNDSISSRTVVFVMQSDCNLVAYQGQRKAVWSSGTAKKGTGCSAVMQTDGNLVVYRGGDRKALWSSNTFHYPGGSLTAQHDGNVVIYQGGKARWATNTVIPQPKKTGAANGSGPFPGCTYARTETKCIVVTEWFKEVYQCGWNYGSMTPIEKSEGWKIAWGACIGFDI